MKLTSKFAVTRALFVALPFMVLFFAALGAFSAAAGIVNAISSTWSAGT